MAMDLHPLLTRDPDLVAGALALRRAVFVEELGAAAGAEEDAFDATCDHLVLRDRAEPGAGIVATLRLSEGADCTEREFDLSALRATGLRIAETGRACLHPAYRGGSAGFFLFRSLLDVLHARDIDVVVGTASFPGADATRHMPALRRLRQEAPAPEGFRPRAHGPGAVDVSGQAPRGAMRDVPTLIKAYLRAGARVGDGAYVDVAFNTVDVCVVLQMSCVTLPRPDPAASTARTEG